MEKALPDHKSVILDAIGPGLESRGYKFVVSRCSFEKKSANESRGVHLFISKNGSASCSVSVRCGIKVAAIDEIYHRTSGIERKYQPHHPTVDLVHRGSTHTIGTIEDLDEAIAEIADFIDRQALPFLERSYSLRDYSDMLNESPCRFHSAWMSRGHYGVVAAKLAGDERFDSLVESYSDLYQKSNDGFYYKGFARLLADLKGEQVLPLPTLVRPPKTDEKARRLLSRELTREILQIRKGTAWKAREGTLFQACGGWFVQAGALVSLADVRLDMTLTIKPIALDTVFWKLGGFWENHKQPLSFRGFGAFTCRPPALAKASMREEKTAAELAAYFLSWADTELERLLPSLTLSGFIEHVRDHPRQFTHLDTLVTAQILAGRFEDARQLCEDALARQQRGTFVSLGRDGFKSYIEMTLEWLTHDPQPVAPVP